MQLTFLSEAPRANRSQSLASEREWLTHGGTSPSPILPLLTAIGPSGWSGRTSPAFCRRTEDGILEPSSEGWQNSGMGSHGEFWTLSTSEHAAFPEPFPNDAGVCSLSQILETGDVPQQYFLSPKACRGILRRAAKRGKELPSQLRLALEQVAMQQEETGPTEQT
jgi:hypothetical protein